MAAELVAACGGLLHGIYLADLVKGLFGVVCKIFLYVDSRNVICAVANTHMMMPKDRSLILPLRQLREHVKEHDVQTVYCPGKHNLADWWYFASLCTLHTMQGSG